MNKKLIALAVAGVVAAPAIAQADANWYGSIRTSLAWDQGKARVLNTGELSPKLEDDVWDIRDHSSRFGVKGDNDLGNGLKAIYRYEFRVVSDRAQLGDEDRLSYVGLGGDWGAVLLGRQWTPYYNAIGAFDVFNTIGLSFYQGTFRASNALAYAWNNDNHLFQIAGIIDGDVDTRRNVDADFEDAPFDDVDGWSAGYKGTFGGFSFALGYNDLKNAILFESGTPGSIKADKEQWSTTLGWNYGENSNVWVNYEDTDLIGEDWTAIWEHGFGAGAANIIRLGYSSFSADTATPGGDAIRIHSSDTSQWMLGYQYNLSDNTRVAVEYAQTDVDKLGPDASQESLKLKGDQLRFFVRTDF